MEKTLRSLKMQPANRVSPDMAGEDVSLLIAGYPDMTATIYTSWASKPMAQLNDQGEKIGALPVFVIDGTEGTLTYWSSGALCLSAESGDEQWIFNRNEGDAEGKVIAQRNFIEGLEKGGQFETSGADYLKTMALVYAAYLSVEEQRVVRPEEVYKPE